MYSCQSIRKTRDNFINRTCGNLSHIFNSVRFSQWDFNSETIWASDEGIKTASASLSRHYISMPFKFGALLGGHCSFSSICRQLSRRHCWETRARRVPCTLLNLPFRLAEVGCTLQWTLGAEINKQLQLLFATTLTLTLRHSDVIVV